MGSDPLILSLETATLGGSVFLGRGTKQLATREGNPHLSHSNTLLTDIDGVLNEAGHSVQEVDLFACASGPGSFTGLRIGIATAKALAATLKRPCLGIPTLHAVALATGPSTATVALLPAGRGEVFAQMFSVSEKSEVTEIDPAAHLSPQRLLEKYGALGDLTWAGSGAQVQLDALQSYAQEHGIVFSEFSPDSGNSRNVHGWKLAAKETKLAKQVAALALQIFASGKIESPGRLSAIYVRPSDAELKEQCR